MDHPGYSMMVGVALRKEIQIMDRKIRCTACGFQLDLEGAYVQNVIVKNILLC